MSAFQRAAVRIAGSGFLLGAAIEYFMIRVQIGSETFCKTMRAGTSQRERKGEEGREGGEKRERKSKETLTVSKH